MQEIVATARTLDVVKAHDGMWMHIEDADSRGHAGFQPPGTRCSNGNRTKIETQFQFSNPLIDEVGRAEYDRSIDIASIE
jgi:hypothetical protein